MNETRLVVGLAIALLLLSLVSMFAAHEKHYKERRYRMLDSRLKTVEDILLEERDS